MEKLYRLYLALALFALLAASFALVLHRNLARTYDASVAASARAMKRAGAIQLLQQLAGDVDAPGNDVFDDGKIEPRALLEDKKLHSELGRALGASRDVAITVTTTSRRRVRRARKATRRIAIVVVGSGAALAASEKLRSKVLDLLFGAEEEFQYTPPVNSASSESTTTVGGAA